MLLLFAYLPHTSQFLDSSEAVSSWQLLYWSHVKSRDKHIRFSHRNSCVELQDVLGSSAKKSKCSVMFLLIRWRDCSTIFTFLRRIDRDSYNTQSWEGWHFCTTSNGNKLETFRAESISIYLCFFVALNDKLKQLTSLFKFEPYKMPILPTLCITEKLEYERYICLCNKANWK